MCSTKYTSDLPSTFKYDINIFGHKLLLRREKNQYILALKFENLHLFKDVDTLRHGHHCDHSAADSRGYWEPPDGLND